MQTVTVHYFTVVSCPSLECAYYWVILTVIVLNYNVLFCFISNIDSFTTFVYFTHMHARTHTCAHTVSHTRTHCFMALLDFVRDQKGKTNLDVLEQEIVSGSGISWAICKSAPLAWISVWGKVQICIWLSWCHCHSLSLPPVNPDWYRLTRVVLDKGAYNDCSCSNSVPCTGAMVRHYWQVQLHRPYSMVDTCCKCCVLTKNFIAEKNWKTAVNSKDKPSGTNLVEVADVRSDCICLRSHCCSCFSSICASLQRPETDAASATFSQSLEWRRVFFFFFFLWGTSIDTDSLTTEAVSVDAPDNLASVIEHSWYHRAR